MSVRLLADHWASNTRIQRAANNNPFMAQFESDSTAVRLLQEALILAGFPMEGGADGAFGPNTAGAVVACEKAFGLKVDAGNAGREVLGVLDLRLRGWEPPEGAHWGGQLAKATLPVALRKVRAAKNALRDIRNMLKFGKFDFVTANGVTMAALKTHFKLVPPGGARLGLEEFIAAQTIDPLIKNFDGIERTLLNPVMIRHTICEGGEPAEEFNGLSTAGEAPMGTGPMRFGPPFSDFSFGDANTTNIEKTGPNSLAAMMIHEATHVIDTQSGNDDTTHISEFTDGYERQPAQHARHNPSAYATFAAHIDDGADRPRRLRYGLGDGRPF